MGISQDASTPATPGQNATASGNSTATTPSFSPPANALLVAIVSVDYGGTLGGISVTDSLSHTWTQKVQNIPASTHTAAAVYELQLGSAPGSMTVSAASTGGSVNGASVQVQVLVLDGAASSQSGAGTGTGGSSTSQASGSATVTTTLGGSWVVIAGAVNTPEASVTPNGNTSTITNWQDATGGDTLLSGKQATPTGTPGATAFGWSWPSSSTWAMAACEILPAGAGLTLPVAQVNVAALPPQPPLYVALPVAQVNVAALPPQPPLYVALPVAQVNIQAWALVLSGEKLIISVTPSAGTDPVTGVPYPKGIAVGAFGAGQIQVLPGSPSKIAFPPAGITLANIPAIASGVNGGAAVLEGAGPSDPTGLDYVFWTLQSGIAGSGAGLFLGYKDGNGGNNTLLQGGFAGLTLPVVGSMSAVEPGTGTSPTNPAQVEPWHPVTVTGSGFSAGTPSPNVKLYPHKWVALAGLVNATSGTTSGTIFTLPAAYRPLSTKKFALPFSAGTPATAGNCQATISSSGTVQISAGPTGAAYSVALDGIGFPLDV